MNVTDTSIITHKADSSIFVILSLLILVMIGIVIFKIICGDCRSLETPVAQGEIIIEIPIAVSISIQTVDNELIGVVL